MICRICGCDVAAVGGVSCGACLAPFHRDCWEFNGGCGIYGCGGKEEKAFEEGAPRGGVLQIEDGTAPPFRLAPHVEGLVRRLPRWGRAVVPPVVVGLGVGLLIVTIVSVEAGEPPPVKAFLWIEGLVALCSLAVSGLADLTRRRPGLMVVAGMVGQGAGFALMRAARSEVTGVGSMCAVVLGMVLTACGLVELVVAGRPALRRLGPWGAVVVRGGATVAALFAVLLVFILGLTGWYTSNLAHWNPVDILGDVFWPGLIFSLLGLVAVAPPLALAWSPLMYRLKKEAEREGAGEGPATRPDEKSRNSPRFGETSPGGYT